MKKKFSQFCKEAKTSIASIQGRRLGLVPDGHGGFHDKKTGEFIAKNTGGKLKFYNQNQLPGQDPKQIRTQNNQRPVATQTFRKRQKATKESIDQRDREREQQLREKYIAGEIFKEGSYITHIPTGQTGKVIRRGTNHLICLTGEPGQYDEFGFSESLDPEMFKCWIRDVAEWTDQSGEPNSSKREVGTDALRKYVMKMTGTKKIHNFPKHK